MATSPAWREQLLSNPFVERRPALRRALDEALAISPTLLERSGEGELERTLLAVLHARALSGTPLAALSSEPVLPARAHKRLPRPYAAYAKVACASARVVARLEALGGTSAAMRAVRAASWAACFGVTLQHGLSLARVVRDHDVLITGETGTGKEGVALAVAAGCVGDAPDGSAPYAEINAAAVPDTLVEGELFGHTKGAFTGATSERRGVIRTADGGCLFLDEVGDLPLQAQVKLLRVIETDVVQPLGSDRARQVDVRFLSATHHDLAARVREGAFRADLFQRLAGVVIRIPPLRERPEDIAAIGEGFVRASLAGLDLDGDAARLVAWLRSAEARAYGWPGNVRELQNVLRNMMLGLPSGALSGVPPSSPAAIPERIAAGEASLADVERWYIERAAARAGGNLAKAARLLGIDRSTLARKLRA